jgi:acetylornithine deacetylase
MMEDPLRLASRLIAIDTRSSRSNVELVDLLVVELKRFEVERLDFCDSEGIAKSVLVALAGASNDKAPIALAAHMDTVPPIGWTRDPFKPAVEQGRLYGLGSCDMKGPLAAAVAAAHLSAASQQVILLLTCDEETTKAGARKIVADSVLLREKKPSAIFVVEPTEMAPLRGHRVDIQFIADASGIAAHSSTPDGVNANVALIPFLSDMRDLHHRLRSDPALQDPDYTPPWCDLNIIIDNYQTPMNATPARATCRMKFRYSRRIPAARVVETVEHSARQHGIALQVRWEGTPPELASDHPLVQHAERVSGVSSRLGAFGSDASQFGAVAPTLLFGPGSMSQAHRPDEYIDVMQLRQSVMVLTRLVSKYDAGILA